MLMLHTRISGCIGISAYTGKELSCSQKKNDHNASLDDFSILSFGSTQSFPSTLFWTMLFNEQCCSLLFQQCCSALMK